MLNRTGNLAGKRVKLNLRNVILGMFFVHVLYGCSPTLTEVSVKLFYEGAEVQCGDHLNIAGVQWQISNFAFYLSAPETAKQQRAQDVVLFDWNRDCGKPLLLSSPIQASLTSGIQIGVPFSLNHVNPLTQSHPLNVSNMFWSWQSGHKFMRLDMKSEQDAWAYHLGSVGCVSASAVRSPETACKYPNTVTLEKNPGQNQLHIHLEKLFDGIVLKAQNRCVMHGANETSCEILYNNLQRGSVFQWH